jgi:UDP-glucuronate decarboxylase
MLELTSLILEETVSKSKIVFQPSPFDDPKQRQPNISLAQESLNWDPKIPLEIGIKKQSNILTEL